MNKTYAQNQAEQCAWQMVRFKNKIAWALAVFGQSQWAHYAHYEGVEFDEREGENIFRVIHLKECFPRNAHKTSSTNSNVLWRHRRTTNSKVYLCIFHVCESTYWCGSVSLCHFHWYHFPFKDGNFHHFFHVPLFLFYFLFFVCLLSPLKLLFFKKVFVLSLNLRQNIMTQPFILCFSEKT